MHHIELEILMNYLNGLAGKVIPALVLGETTLASTCIVMLLHFDSNRKEHGCSYCVALCLAAFADISWIGCFNFYHQLENLSQESVECLKAVDLKSMQEIRLQRLVLGKHSAGVALPTRHFRRPIIRVKLGNFGYIEPGFALSFFQQTLDTIVTYVFMVKIEGEMWLL